MIFIFILSICIYQHDDVSILNKQCIYIWSLCVSNAAFLFQQKVLFKYIHYYYYHYYLVLGTWSRRYVTHARAVALLSQLYSGLDTSTVPLILSSMHTSIGSFGQHFEKHLKAVALHWCPCMTCGKSIENKILFTAMRHLNCIWIINFVLVKWPTFILKRAFKKINNTP